MRILWDPLWLSVVVKTYTGRSVCAETKSEFKPVDDIRAPNGLLCRLNA